MQNPAYNDLNVAVPSSRNTNSSFDLLTRGEGLQVSKANVCDGNGAQHDNLFTITGQVKILAIWAEITQVTNGTTLSGNSLELYDGTASVEITDEGAPLDLSGATEVGGVLIKNGASATVALANQRVNVGGVSDTMAAPFHAWKKSGATTYIRHNFTGDANTNVSMTWYVRYVKLTSDGAVTAV